MPRSKGGERVLGPYPHGTRWRIIHVHPGRVGRSGGERTPSDFATEEEAIRVKRALLKKVAPAARSVREALGAFFDHLRENEREGKTIEGYEWALGRMFPEVDVPLEDLVRPEVCLALYTKLRTGKPQKGKRERLATDSHRNILVMSRTFVRWCGKFPRRWLAANGFDVVEGVGRRSRGKPKLTIDEARRFLTTAAVRANAGDQGGVAAMMLLLLGLRGSEVARRRVRDVDNDGTLLRVMRQRELGQGTKTETSERDIWIPELLRPYLAALCDGKAPTDWLWDPVRNGSGAATGKILEALSLAGAPLGAEELAAATGVGLDVVRTLLYRLVKRGLALRTARGDFRAAAEHGLAALRVRRKIEEGWEPSRFWVLKSVKRLCREANTIEVTAHSLRGLQTDLATIGGLDGLLRDVAAGIGHAGGTGVMERHYLSREVLAGERQGRALGVLLGGRVGPARTTTAESPERKADGNETPPIVPGRVKGGRAK